MEKENTPMMQQWLSCKKKAENALLFFRLGDFYEAFYEDAHIISKEIDLTLTKRQEVPMCGVPFHSSDIYIDKLVAKGYKIAVAEQIEDPKAAKGLVKRDIIRIVTPATIVNSSLISDKSNNFFVSIAQAGSIFGLAAIDLSTSDFLSMELDNIKDLKDELYKLKPSEFLFSKKFSTDHNLFLDSLSYGFKFIANVKDEWHFDHKTCYETLTSHFKVHSLDGFGLRGQITAINAAGALLNYLRNDLSLDISHLQRISKDSLSDYMGIDYSCMKNLEILESSSLSSKKNTLLDVLDYTCTPMGGRLIKNWVKHPLLNIEDIKNRQDAIEELKNNGFALEGLVNHLSKVRDLERLIMKISCGYANPKDLASLRTSLENVPLFKTILKDFKAPLIVKERENIKDISDVTSLIEKSISDNPPFRLTDGGTIKEGYNKDLDELRSIRQNSRQWLANYQNTLKEETKIKTLKVGYTKVFGYYIEVSKGQTDKIPSNFQRKQTLVNGERFISEELKSFEHKILTAEEQIKALEATLFEEIKQNISKYSEDINSIAKACAVIDVICSLSSAAKEYEWTRPIVDNSDILQIKDGRHPIIEAASNLNSFVPNDTFLDEKANRLFLITGPNMAGKSTYIRQVALLTIMSQIGSFIPASEAHIGIIDKIFSRIGANDDLTRGQSTFMVEMSETANILNNATSKSLVILDEIGRGTSTYDGISIAWAVAEYLLTTPHKRAKTLFATHYWELTDLEKKIEGAVNYNVAVKETSTGIVFLRKIIRGGTDKSYGIHVARLAGVPFQAIKKAEEMLIELEKTSSRKNIKASSKQPNEYPLFSYNTPPPPAPSSLAIEELKNLNVNNLTPIEALQKLFEIKEKVTRT